MCANGTFTPVPDKQGSGLHEDSAAQSAIECENNCCADPSCIVWQFADTKMRGVGILRACAAHRLWQGEFASSTCRFIYLFLAPASSISSVNAHPEEEELLPNLQTCAQSSVHPSPLTIILFFYPHREVAGADRARTRRASGSPTAHGMAASEPTLPAPAPAQPRSPRGPCPKATTTPNGPLSMCLTISSSRACTIRGPLLPASLTCPAPMRTTGGSRACQGPARQSVWPHLTWMCPESRVLASPET